MDFCAHEDRWWILYVRVPKYLIYFHYKKKCIKQGQIIGCVWVNFFWRCPCSYSLHILKLRFLFLASPGIERFFFFCLPFWKTAFSTLVWTWPFDFPLFLNSNSTQINEKLGVRILILCAVILSLIIQLWMVILRVA